MSQIACISLELVSACILMVFKTISMKQVSELSPFELEKYPHVMVLLKFLPLGSRYRQPG